MQDHGSIRQRFVRTKTSGGMEIVIDYTVISEDQFNQGGV
jgi:hypothetical protein